MIIKYGLSDNNVDVTSICNDRLKCNGIIIIPSGDYRRAEHFTDPLPGVSKSIFITDTDNNTTRYDHTKTIYIDTINDTMLSENVMLIKYGLLIKYGRKDDNIDVTIICISQLKFNDFVIIPSDDYHRTEYFTDPLPGIPKSIFITDADNNITEYDQTRTIYIDTITNTIMTENIPDSVRLLNINEKVSNIQSKLRLNHDSFRTELPEQRMVVRYIIGNEKVLEIGGNIGRNSLVVSYILGQNNNNNFVVLESNESISIQLKENKEINNAQFHVENSALSKRKLIQKGWNTVISDTLLEGYSSVNVITYDELLHKYNIQFDTLILDCEGSFYYILKDMPEILKNIKLIIMENDYTDINHKIYIDTVLKSNNFFVEYTESGGWGPCFNNFFEVWKKPAF